MLAVITLPTFAAGISFDLVETGSATTRTWNSGKDKHLSDYKTITCPEEFGNERLLVAFKGFREPSLNADNFITELSATCRRFGPDQGWVPYGVADLPPVDNTKRLFASKHRDDSVKTEVPIGGNGNFVPNGVHLEVNSNEYVKDINIIYQVSYPTGLGGSVQHTVGMSGLSGNGSERSVDLKCPADFALTGTKVKFSTDDGKIRVFQIECRRLVYRPITASSAVYATEGHPWKALNTNSGNVLVSVSGSKIGVQVFSQGGAALESSCVKTLPAAASYAANLRFAPGSGDIAAGIGDAGVIFYDADDLIACKSGAGNVIVGQGEGPGTLDVAVTPDGQYAFVLNEYGDVEGDPVQSHSGSVGVIKIERDASGRITTGTRLLGRIPTAGRAMAGMKLSPDGTRLYVSTQVSDNLELPPGNTDPVLFHKSRCVQGLGSSMSTGLLTVINVAKAKRKQDVDAIASTVAAGCSPTRIAVTADGKTLWVAARGDNRVLAFSTALLESNPARALLGYASTGGDAPVGLALLHNDKFLAVANSNRFNPDNVGRTNATILSVANPAAAVVVETIATGDFPREIIAGADDATLYLTNYLSDTLQVIQTTVH
jgi:DNA-binding beta-propeller fold protein YncE